MSQLVLAVPIVFASLACSVDVDVWDVSGRASQAAQPASETATAALPMIPPGAAVSPQNHGRLLLHAAVHVLTSPARWDRNDWRDAELIALICKAD